jgi:hypothetical protein
MSKLGMVLCLAAGTLLLPAHAFPQNASHQGQGQVVVTVLPKHAGGVPLSIPQQDLKIAVNGKPSSVTNWVPLRGPDASVELVLLIDNSARTSLGSQMDDIAHFIQSLPPNAKSAIAYMDYGRAVLAGPLSTDHAAVLRGLHLPGGAPGSSASPYFCLSNLAKHWPSADRQARREVVMVTDGVDDYNPRFDPTDPYVQTAIADSVRAGLVVYSIYWRDQGFAGHNFHENYAGENLLSEVTEATGGTSCWVGYGNPVSFRPFFSDLTRRLQNQYELSFVARLNDKPEIESLKLKMKVPGTEIYTPEQVFVGRSSTALH